MYEFIFEYISKSPFYYISVFEILMQHTLMQHITDNNLQCVPYKEQFFFCTKKLDINTIENRYAKIGVDFIFSPFAILNHIFKKHINKKMVLFVLIEGFFFYIGDI